MTDLQKLPLWKRLVWKLPVQIRKRYGFVSFSDFPKLKLHERLSYARVLPPVQSDYRVVFEANIDSPASILVPDPNWMACALHGGILPPVEVYHRLETDDNGRIINGRILHDTPLIGPMSEEEAIEYLIQKDVPAHVWQGSQGNRPKFVICRKTQLPQSREFRNAWALKEVA